MQRYESVFVEISQAGASSRWRSRDGSGGPILLLSVAGAVSGPLDQGSRHRRRSANGGSSSRANQHQSGIFWAVLHSGQSAAVSRQTGAVVTAYPRAGEQAGAEDISIASRHLFSFFLATCLTSNAPQVIPNKTQKITVAVCMFNPSFN